MRRHPGRLVLLAATPLLLGAVKLPDLSEGVIDGRAAMIVWPRHNKVLIEPDRCVAHLVRRDGSDSELTLPCGAWIQPPPATYWLWLEQRDLISPMRDLVVWLGGPFQGRGLGSVHDLVVGGWVQLAPGVAMSGNHRLELVHFDSHRRFGVNGRLFTRLVEAAKGRSRVLMPAGRILAAITDVKGNVLALTPPLTVPERGTVAASPQPPKSGTDVFVALVRARAPVPVDGEDVTLTLRTGKVARVPDAMISAVDRIYAVWYSVDAPRAVFEATGSTAAWPAEELILRGGTVVTLRRTLKLRPSVNVSVSAPAGALADEKMSIEVTTADGRHVRHAELRSPSTRIEHLPAEPLRVSLNVGAWRSTQEVDLSSFQDQELSFELQPIVVAGTVYHGSRAVPATVKFYVAPEWVETTTDDGGAYRLTLLEPRTYSVEVRVRDGPTPAYREYFVDLLQSQTRDFHVPDTDYRVRVTDGRSGGAIAGAEVVALNKFLDDERREQTALQRTTTDGEGNALLPPLRPGTAGIVARAVGYRSSEPVVLPIGASGNAQRLEVRLHRERESAVVTLVLPNGEAAASAAITAIDSAGDTILWQSTSAADGTVEIPGSLAGALLVVKHAAAGAVVRQWRADDAGAAWPLPGRAAPLLVRVVDGSGAAVPFAELTLWLDGVPLRGMALRLAAEAPPRTDGFGQWTAASLAPQTLQILATRRAAASTPAVLAQRVVPPWPDPIAVRVVE